MNRRIFETYITTQFALTLKPGDVVIIDNLRPTSRTSHIAGQSSQGCRLRILTEVRYHAFR